MIKAITKSKLINKTNNKMKRIKIKIKKNLKIAH